MLPAEFESIAAALQTRFREWISTDTEGVVVANLLCAEELISSFVLETGREMLQAFVDIREVQAKALRPLCSCGARTEVHHVTTWTRKTLLGPVTVRDPYSFCRICGDSTRPLQMWLGTDRETWSLAAQEAAVDLAADESCGKAVEKLERHHPGVEMGRTTALRLLHEHGRAARKFINEKLEDARQLAELPPALAPSGADELEVEFDGGMIPVATLAPVDHAPGDEPERTPVRGLVKRKKECRWEEVKVGLVQKPGEVARLYSLRPTDDLDESFDDLFDLACMKGLSEHTQVRGISDGAPHIRPRMKEAFNACDFRFILDRPHAKEHLSSAGKALEPITGIPAQQWAEEALKKLEVGDAKVVVAELQQAHEKSGSDKASRNETLRKEAGYFERNQDAVAYADYRNRGWSTASSEVESAHRHTVQTRLKISGAWWHPDGVDDILALRMLKANGWWDEYWDRQRQEWRRRAEGFTKARRERAA